MSGGGLSFPNAWWATHQNEGLIKNIEKKYTLFQEEKKEYFKEPNKPKPNIQSIQTNQNS